MAYEIVLDSPIGQAMRLNPLLRAAASHKVGPRAAGFAQRDDMHSKTFTHFAQWESKGTANSMVHLHFIPAICMCDQRVHRTCIMLLKYTDFNMSTHMSPSFTESTGGSTAHQHTVVIFLVIVVIIAVSTVLANFRLLSSPPTMPPFNLKRLKKS